MSIRALTVAIAAAVTVAAGTLPPVVAELTGEKALFGMETVIQHVNVFTS
ncbi:hypothetical protein ACIBQX_37875 [Nonomuraea sp. NPDC049714]